ncbi:acireductone synthase [Saccharopolyspora gloriosae]|uniref:acireductone synthase n=1 Tax=Saccharopolyspora gloriosae TaxID=455344 RepID=UPI001FB72690|nr:acireductone synthase [Saccharopolyspora gloriosae]
MTAPTAARWVVIDIEGTVTPTSQVHRVLYDYARPRLGPWIDAHPHDPDVEAAVAAVRDEAGLDADADTAAIVAVLHQWMDADRKATPLKTLQGLIWQQGYADKQLRTDLFGDVVGALLQFREQGAGLAVFSSGSVAAQIASFSHTGDGDLRHLFTHHFDTVNAGPKRVADSYRTMTDVLGVAPEAILFASDVPAELDAAAEAGWQTVGLARPGEPFADTDFGAHRAVTTFDDISIEVPA